MNAPRRSTSMLLPAAILAALLSACSPSPSGPGQLALQLVDAPNPAVDQIVVNISTVTAHSTSAGWVTVGPIVSPTAVNLLDLQSSALALGIVNLPPGKITQIRMLVEPTGNYVVPTGSSTHEPLIVPSGLQTGIKIVGQWDVSSCALRTVTLDFDGKSSIEYHQADGTWILRPVVRVKRDESAPIACQPEPPPPPPPSCGLEVPCPVGQTCLSGVCAPAAPLSTGSACTDGWQCLTGSCNDGTCGPGPAGASCGGNADCQSLSCVGGTCGAAGMLGAGARCSDGGACMSGDCTGGTCQPGMQGAPCAGASDCLSLYCTASTCMPSP